MTHELGDPRILRRKLLANGYEPVPIAGKSPRHEEWSRGKITEERLAAIEAAHPDHTNTGIRTGCLAVFDVDLTDPAHLAEIECVIMDVLGGTWCRRVGSKGAALGYYNPHPISKITISGAGKRLVEILGKGQQLASYGAHPTTARPYVWTYASLGEDPLQTPLTELPAVTPGKLREAASKVADTLNRLGYANVTVSEAGASSKTNNAPSSPAAGAPVSPAIIEAMLRCIPPSCDRHGWLTVCGGLVNAPVKDPEWDGLEIFMRWSRGDFHGDVRPENFKGEDDCAAQWRRDLAKRGVLR